MVVLFDVTTDTPLLVEYDSETFEVFGHVQILSINDESVSPQEWQSVD
jgi:hypothetical protein